MTLSDFSIKRPVFAWVLMFGLIFFGCLAFTRMGINENPDVEYPTLSIRYSYPGATPGVVEKDILEPVENVLVSMEGIRYMTSTAERSSGRIQLEFGLDRDVDFALQEVNSLIGRAQRQLPDNLAPPVVTKSNADDRPIMYLALSTESLTQRELMLLFRDQVRDRISTVEGVSEVRAFGYHEPMLRIDLNAAALKRYQLTANDVVDSIRQSHSELPAGKFEYDKKEELIRIMGEAAGAEEFENIVISRRGGAPNFLPIKIKQVATVYEGIENIRRISRVDGKPALGVAIQKRRGVNAVATAEQVKERLAEVNKDLPKGTALTINFDSTQFIKESVNELVFTLILSALLTSFVCWFFIGSFTAAANILLAIPTAVIGTFIFIQWLGFTLNAFTLLGLTLAIGVVVDDAIVMLENIVRYMQEGWDRVNAAFKGAREMTFAVLATTIALIAIFIPITFIDGIEGRFFYEFAVTISIAVALSSLEALTLAPMRSSQFLVTKVRTSWLGKGLEDFILAARRWYAAALAIALRRRVIVLVGAFAVFLASLFVVRHVPTEIAPDQDRSALFLVFIAPDGVNLDYTVEKVAEFEKIAMAHPAVRRVFTVVGGFGDGGQSNRGNGVVILHNHDQRKLDQFEVAAELRKQTEKIEGLRVFIRDRGGSPLSGRRGSPIEFTITGPDLQKQREFFSQLKTRMDESGTIVGTRSDDTATLPEVHIVPDRDTAAASGVEVAEISRTVNVTYGGAVATQVTQGGSRFDVFVQLQDKDRATPDQLNNILIRNNRGEMLPLAGVVDLRSTEGPQSIFRENRQRALRVDASLAKGVNQGQAVAQIQEWGREILPQGYLLNFTSTPDEKLGGTLLVLALGLLIAYMVLAVQFNSFVDPFIVFLAVPFGFSGAVLALMLGGQTLNLYSAIGILLTLGIVKKNSILLVEFTNQLRDKGEKLNDAVRKACDLRLRPIMMTNLATLAAAVPPALAVGPGSETRLPMALTILGGVSLSVLFTLLVVPCAISLIGPKRIKIREGKEAPTPKRPLQPVA